MSIVCVVFLMVHIDGSCMTCIRNCLWYFIVCNRGFVWYDVLYVLWYLLYYVCIYV